MVGEEEGLKRDGVRGSAGARGAGCRGKGSSYMTKRICKLFLVTIDSVGLAKGTQEKVKI
jgi:hypothetical protein